MAFSHIRSLISSFRPTLQIDHMILGVLITKSAGFNGIICHTIRFQWQHNMPISFNSLYDPIGKRCVRVWPNTKTINWQTVFEITIHFLLPFAWTGVYNSSIHKNGQTKHGSLIYEYLLVENCLICVSYPIWLRLPQHQWPLMTVLFDSNSKIPPR